MMRFKTVVPIVAALVLVVGIIPVFAQGQPMGTPRAGQQGMAGPMAGSGPMSGRAMMPRSMMSPTRVFMPRSKEWVAYVASQIGMTDDQKTKGTDMLKALEDKIQAMNTGSTANADLIAEMRSNTTDAAKVQKLATKVMQDEEAVLQAELKTWIEFKKMLTPEQQTKFMNFMIPSPMMGGPGMGGPGMAPPPAPGAGNTSTPPPPAGMGNMAPPPPARQ